MVFSTILFLCVFLPFVIIGYFIMPQKGKNLFLLLCSLFFYAWGEPKYIWIMLGSILCNYFLGLLLIRFEKSKLIMTIGIVANLILLIVFKYFTFLMTGIRTLVDGTFDIIQIALPIGISFYTFQGLSYIIDVYRYEGTIDENGTKIKFAQRNVINLALYISMFPQLIAGPIVRYGDVKDSLSKRKTSIEDFAYGAERFIIGLSKKAILANMVGSLAEDVFSQSISWLSAPVAWLGVLAYALQIYFDFSGYSDMAIGLGRIFGFCFMENFQYPYIAKTVQEFWRRWHISLSQWFRDYLYIPLGGNRTGNVYLHLLIVFAATGIWHGAEWNFLVWGLWHGSFMILERITVTRLQKKGKQIRIPSFLCWTYTMLVVGVGWVIFRLTDMKEVLSYVAVMFGIRRNSYIAYDVGFYMSRQMCFYFVVSILACIPWKAVWMKIEKKHTNKSSLLQLQNNPILLIVKRISLIVLLMLCFVFIINSSYNPFIYFRF